MEVKTFEDLAKAFGTHNDEVKASLKALTEKAGELSERMQVTEQRLARSGPGTFAPSQPTSLGQQFIEQEGLKHFAEVGRNGQKFDFETKATLTSATADAMGSVGGAIQPFRDPEITPLPSRRPVVRDLLTAIPMTGGSVEVPRVAGRDRNAAPVAEAAAKPQSSMQLELETVNARVIAHWMKVSRQVLSDLPQLKGLIDTELLDGLVLAEEGQLLNGDGSGQNLNGLIPNAQAFDAPIMISDANRLDIVGLALLQSALAEFPATGIILHPADWTRITLLKDDKGNYIMGPPGSAIPQRLWGLPVITTQAMGINKFLVGDFRRAATLYDRWNARVEVGYVDDDFTRNLITVLAEERLAQAIKQPLALTYGEFTGPE